VDAAHADKVGNPQEAQIGHVKVRGEERHKHDRVDHRLKREKDLAPSGKSVNPHPHGEPHQPTAKGDTQSEREREKERKRMCVGVLVRKCVCVCELIERVSERSRLT
jgi:hypothetical protein